GKNNGILNGVRSFGSMLGPAIGAGILVFENSRALLFVSILFLTLSIVPLLAIQRIKRKVSTPSISFKTFFEEVPERKNFISWFLYSIHLAANEVIWPIFIFSFFGTLGSIALVAVIISVSKILLAYISGSASVKNREHLIVAGIASLLAIWIARLVYPSPVFYYLSILLVGFFTILIEVPLDNSIFERARLKNQSLNASTMRNAIIMFPQGVLFAILALFIGVFKISFVAAIASLAVLLVVNHALLYFYKKELRPGA
ncbi:MAG TPA: hypothetical protein VEA37_08320, partial [Flavobacterium sp.]|nr:hypothetical protein [Flavobacterium sp.]